MPDSTRDRILEAASSIIRNSGPDGLTMDTAADLAGVSRKTIYNYFDGRTALIEGAAESWMTKTLEALEAIVDDDGKPFIDKLNAIVERGFDELRQGGRLLDGTGAGRPAPMFSGVRQTLHGSLRSLIRTILVNAREEGIVRPSFDPDRLTLVIINIVQGLSLLGGFEDESCAKVDILRDSLKAIVGGILTDKGAEAMKGSPILDGGGTDGSDEAGVMG